MVITIIVNTKVPMNFFNMYVSINLNITFGREDNNKATLDQYANHKKFIIITLHIHIDKLPTSFPNVELDRAFLLTSVKPLKTPRRDSKRPTQ
jgi:hypothetical protein